MKRCSTCTRLWQDLESCGIQRLKGLPSKGKEVLACDVDVVGMVLAMGVVHVRRTGS